MEPAPSGSPTTYSDALAAEVRAGLGRAHLSQTDLAAAIGVSPATMSRKLTGQHPFNTDELERIAAHLRVSPSSLLAAAEAALGVAA